ncbi:fimbria/pilus outer membrane usher protein [Escherichia coli]
MEYTAGCHLFYAARSSSKLNNDTRHEGTSYQVAYNKYLVQTATRFSVAARRYASQGLQDIQRPSLRK